MTQPIQEPSLSRTDSAMGYGQRQLFRRPSPVTAGGACDRGYMFNGEGPTIPDDTFTNIEDYSDGLNGFVIDCNLVDGEFEISATGIYLVQIVIVYLNTFAGGKAARIQIATTGVLQDTNYWQNWVSEQDTTVNADQVCAEALIFCTNVDDPLRIQGATKQLSGGPEDLVTVDFSVVRLCDFDITAS